jgi:hypothetical protein
LMARLEECVGHRPAIVREPAVVVGTEQGGGLGKAATRQDVTDGDLLGDQDP